MTDPGIYSIFDPPPSSMKMLREKPLGLDYREPTLRELMQPMPPPDKVLFKHGAIFNRFVHSASRKRLYDNGDSGSGRMDGGSISGRRRNKSPPSAANSTTTTPTSQQKNVASSMTPQQSGDLQQNHQHETMKMPSSEQQQQQQESDTAGPDVSFMTPAAPLDSHKSINVLARSLGGNTTRIKFLGRGGNNQDRDINNNLSASFNSNPLSGVRQQLVPSARLPNRGCLPQDAASIILADVRGAAIASRWQTSEFIRRSREVITGKHDGTVLERGCESPLKAYEDLVRRMSPCKKRKPANNQPPAASSTAAAAPAAAAAAASQFSLSSTITTPSFLLQDSAKKNKKKEKKRTAGEPASSSSASASRNNNSPIRSSSKERRPSPLKKLFLSAKEQASTTTLAGAITTTALSSSSMRGGGGGGRKSTDQKTDDDDNEGSDSSSSSDGEYIYDEGANDDDWVTQAMAILKDPNLSRGIIFKRSLEPPWIDGEKRSGGDATTAGHGAATANIYSAKMMKGGKKKKSASATTPRFAAQTAAHQSHARRSSQTALLQINTHNNISSSSGGGGGGDLPATATAAAATAEQQDDDSKGDLLGRAAAFYKQLRVEDKDELQRARKALQEQRKRHLDEMTLARLAPAEREERMANKATLDPYRKPTDRNLPFPETAARDRYTQAQRSEFSELVMEGMEQITRWRPPAKKRKKQQQQQQGQSDNSSNGTNDDDLHQFTPSNASILIQQMGLASAPALSASGSGMGGGMSGGGGGNVSSRLLRASAAQTPKEGMPRMRNPASPRELHDKHEKAQTRVMEQEGALANKMQSLSASMETRHAKAESKKTLFV